MTREDVLRYVIKCPHCRTTYMPVNGEICKCERPNPEEEPRVSDWEDSSITEALKHVAD